MKNKLYVVSLPIGNLNELTFLAKKVLLETRLIICEDTRNIKKFFTLNQWNYEGITFVSYHKFNEASKNEQIFELLNEFKVGVLVSDAGYPGICDPGSKLIELCHENNVDIQVVNGPCALIHCLVASGWSENPFLFGGFASHSTNQIIKQLHMYETFQGIIIFYVSAHALENFMESVESIFGDSCQICIGRELTKKYEELLIGTISKVKSQLKDKGEFVFLINNVTPKMCATTEEKISMIRELVSLGMKTKNACKFLAKHYHCSSNELYEMLTKANE